MTGQDTNGIQEADGSIPFSSTISHGCKSRSFSYSRLHSENTGSKGSPALNSRSGWGVPWA